MVLELCDHCLDSVRVNMFGLEQRVRIPSLRTTHHAPSALLAAIEPSELDSREGYLHWWRVLLEDAEGSSAVELFRQLLVLECLCRNHNP